ncbi:MAG: hypothetical protein AAFR51_15930 [Pseudomonadota bacterium]
MKALVFHSLPVSSPKHLTLEPFEFQGDHDSEGGNMTARTGRFFRSSAREWRIILVGLTLTLFINAGVAFLSIYNSARHGHGPSFYFTALTIILACIVLLFKDLTVKNSQYPLSASMRYFFGLSLILAILSLTTVTYFSDIHQSEKDLKAQWAISELCFSDGEIDPNNTKTCLALMPLFNGRICALGATPMRKCEVALRRRIGQLETGAADV